MYKIALTQVSFDNSYTNVLRFDSRAEQQAYFKVNTLFANITKEINYPFGTFYVTRLPIRLDNTEQQTALSYNYAIVKDLTREDTYFYYFIKNANYDSGNTQMLVDLELDIFQTYYLDTEFTPCLVNRAHLDRWGEIVDGKVSFNSNPDSLLFEQERIKTNSKRLVEREEIDISKQELSNLPTDIKNYLSNMPFWVYMYVKPTIYNLDLGQNFSYTHIQSQSFRVVFDEGVPFYNTDSIDENLICLVFPANTIDVVYNNKQYAWSFRSLSVNTGKDTILSKIAPYIVDVQVSNIIPTQLLIGNPTYQLDFMYNRVRITATSSSNETCGLMGTIDEVNPVTSVFVLMYIGYYKYSSNTDNITLPIDYKFNVEQIINAQHSLTFNPKLLTAQYCELRVGIGNGNPQIYDILKLNLSDERFPLEYKFAPSFQPGIYNAFLGLYKTNNSVYTKDLLKTYVGATASIDAGLIYNIDMLSEFLAQNKNFYQIRSNQYASRSAKWLASTTKSIGSGVLGGAFTGGPAGALIGGLSGAVSGIANAIDIALDYENSNLTLDNMDNAPETFKNLDNAPYLNYEINQFRPYYEIWKPLECELRIADNDMNMFGYTYNQIDNVKNCDNIRHYWNFVQAQLENITSTMIMSNEVRQRFKNVFARGVRFWNITDLVINDTYNYQTHENYERRLTDELQENV